MRILIAPTAIGITLISFSSYLKFRNWRLLFLSAAFLLLSIPPTIELVLFSGLFQGIPAWTMSELFYISYIFSTASVLPFALLTCVYFNERKTRSIVITRNQWILGGLLVLAELVFITYALVLFFGNNGNSSAQVTWDFFSLLNFISGCISYILIILIITSLFSYYRAKKTKSTLVVMTGFIFLLLSQLYGNISSLLFYSPRLSYNLGVGLVTTSIELAGYIAFLIALLHPKVFR
jgi:hypothetical protein